VTGAGAGSSRSATGASSRGFLSGLGGFVLAIFAGAGVGSGIAADGGLGATGGAGGGVGRSIIRIATGWIDNAGGAGRSHNSRTTPPWSATAISHANPCSAG
jgi:hypothetical protein